MKVTEKKPSSTLYFHNLKPGEVFRCSNNIYSDDLCMKINPSGGGVDTVRLEDGYGSFTASSVEVFPVNGTFVEE